MARAILDNREEQRKEITENILLSIASGRDFIRARHVSPYYLSKMLRKYTGKTCTEIISLERVEAAKKLLLRNYNSKETCYQVGFNSQNYFAKIFKKLCGMTPGEYRGGALGRNHRSSFAFSHP
ncbi:MAG: helix-turn-helix transcriptional regulator [Treponema sp.]|nr:helix-turn-helix transcriptional regulator [Treponema sp.]